jgi:hypothetical protein
MFPRLTFAEFKSRSLAKNVAVLFIRQHGCQHCEAAEKAMKDSHLIAALSEVEFFQLFIDDEPQVPQELGLIGVPAFLKINSDGRKCLKTGFDNITGLQRFIQN